jgi:hypothetical protein
MSGFSVVKRKVRFSTSLFYVAMTRAMEELVIYTWEPSKSEFLEEIKEHIDEEPLYY